MYSNVILVKDTQMLFPSASANITLCKGLLSRNLNHDWTTSNTYKQLQPSFSTLRRGTHLVGEESNHKQGRELDRART
jgi:hypothetical protein